MCTVLEGGVGRGLLIEDNRPVFLTELEPLSIDSGDKAVFRVQARGNPPPTFLWYANNTSNALLPYDSHNVSDVVVQTRGFGSWNDEDILFIG